MVNRVIFVGRTGACREAMAAGILQVIQPAHPVEALARGLVVQFPGPMNQKAEAVMISNGHDMENFTAKQLQNEEITPQTLVLTFDGGLRAHILQEYPNAGEEQVQVLSDYVGEELEVINPYGGTLKAYGLCYETLRSSILKLVEILNKKE